MGKVPVVLAGHEFGDAKQSLRPLLVNIRQAGYLASNSYWSGSQLHDTVQSLVNQLAVERGLDADSLKLYWKDGSFLHGPALQQTWFELLYLVEHSGIRLVCDLELVEEGKRPVLHVGDSLQSQATPENLLHVHLFQAAYEIYDWPMSEEMARCTTLETVIKACAEKRRQNAACLRVYRPGREVALDSTQRQRTFYDYLGMRDCPLNDHRCFSLHLVEKNKRSVFGPPTVKKRARSELSLDAGPPAKRQDMMESLPESSSSASRDKGKGRLVDAPPTTVQQTLHARVSSEPDEEG